MLILSSKPSLSSSTWAGARLACHTSVDLTGKETMSPNGLKDYITYTA